MSAIKVPGERQADGVEDAQDIEVIDIAIATPVMNFKRQLLAMIKIIVLEAHHCPSSLDNPTGIAATVEATRLAFNVKRVIVAPKFDGCHATHPVCNDYPPYNQFCPILVGMQECREATMHCVGSDGPTRDSTLGPLHAIIPLLDHLDQLTLVFPPAGCIFKTSENRDAAPNEHQLVFFVSLHDTSSPSVSLSARTNKPASVTQGSSL